MRRKDREANDFSQIKEIIAECDVIRLGFSDGEFPYIVPVNFGYEIENQQIYFYIHGALEGKKLELIKKSGICSFEMDCAHAIELLPELKNVTMRYKCLMGKAKIEILAEADKQHGIDMLMGRYAETKNFAYDKKAADHIMVAKLTVLEYSGKINAPKKMH